MVVKLRETSALTLTIRLSQWDSGQFWIQDDVPSVEKHSELYTELLGEAKACSVAASISIKSIISL